VDPRSGLNPEFPLRLCYDAAVSTLSRLRRAWWGIRQELRWGSAHVVSGRLAYMVNVIAYRILALWPKMPGSGAVSRLVTDGGMIVYYRRDRGDIQGIREIFIDEIYRLPDGAAPSSLVDLGANIGLATLWLCSTYGIGRFAAYEPQPENFALLERNCAVNGLRGQLNRTAVGTENTVTFFDTSTDSNMGRVGTGTLIVEVESITSIVENLPFDPSLLKLDVEGMERDLVTLVDPGWIRRFELVVMEMHPQYFDIGPVIETIASQGFEYFAPLEVSRGTRRAKRERLFVRAGLGVSR